MTKKICISGYYGFNNFGDETILKILTENLSQYEITVFSSNPNQTKNNLKVNSVYTFDILKVIGALKKCDCLISGGGSLLQDSSSKKSLIYYLFVIASALFFKKKVIIFAQGIGPIKNKFLLKITLELLKHAKYITVRDKNSKTLLDNYQINSILCSDPVWNLEKINTEKNNIIGIQLRNHPNLSDNFIEYLANNINQYYQNKKIHILAMQNCQDLNVCNKLRDKLLNINPNLKITVKEHKTTEETIKNIAGLNELIAMRYHACLIAIKNEVKILPINYDIKVEELAKEFKLKYMNLRENENKIADFIRTDIKYDKNKINQKKYNFEELIKEINL